MTIYQNESWVYGPGTRKMDPDARDDAITDAALEQLSAECIAGRTHVLCPGCDLLVSKHDLSDHARMCGALRALAEQREAK